MRLTQIKRTGTFYSDNQDVKVDVLLYDENIWLTQKQMAQLFDKAKSTINEHIKNIFKDGELIEIKGTGTFYSRYLVYNVFLIIKY
jgi:hypothetical protein